MAEVIKGMLKEELERSYALEKKYEKKLKGYPPGYLLKRRLRDKLYYYLSFREGDRIRQKYLGSLSPEEVKGYKDRIKDKNYLKKQLQEAKQNIQYLKRLLKK
jgi:hypothetical protein